MTITLNTAVVKCEMGENDFYNLKYTIAVGIFNILKYVGMYLIIEWGRIH